MDYHHHAPMAIHNHYHPTSASSHSIANINNTTTTTTTTTTSNLNNNNNSNNNGSSTPSNEQEHRDRLASVVACIIDQVFGRRRDMLPADPARLTMFHTAVHPNISARDYFVRIVRYLPFVSGESMITALILLNRLLHYHPLYELSSLNVHRLLLTSLVCASKFNDDTRIKNKYFGGVGGVDIRELNVLEVELLSLLHFDLDVTPQLYSVFVRAVAHPALHTHCTCLRGIAALSAFTAAISNKDSFVGGGGGNGGNGGNAANGGIVPFSFSSKLFNASIEESLVEELTSGSPAASPSLFSRSARGSSSNTPSPCLSPSSTSSSPACQSPSSNNASPAPMAMSPLLEPLIMGTAPSAGSMLSPASASFSYAMDLLYGIRCLIPPASPPMSPLIGSPCSSVDLSSCSPSPSSASPALSGSASVGSASTRRRLRDGTAPPPPPPPPPHNHPPSQSHPQLISHPAHQAPLNGIIHHANSTSATQDSYGGGSSSVAAPPSGITNTTKSASSSSSSSSLSSSLSSLSSSSSSVAPPVAMMMKAAAAISPSPPSVRRRIGATLANSGNHD